MVVVGGTAAKNGGSLAESAALSESETNGYAQGRSPTRILLAVHNDEDDHLLTLYSRFLHVLAFLVLKMWRPATREVTGTNESACYFLLCSFFSDAFLLRFSAPLGNRRRFGPAPVEDAAPPQLAQPSPSAYPRPPPTNGREDLRSSRDQSPVANSAGKFSSLCPPRYPFLVGLICVLH